MRQPLSAKIPIFLTDEGIDAGILRSLIDAEVRPTGNDALHASTSLKAGAALGPGSRSDIAIVVVPSALEARTVGQPSSTGTRARATTCDSATDTGATIV